MWIVVELYSDCTTLEDVGVSLFHDRNEAVAFLVSGVEDCMDDEIPGSSEHVALSSVLEKIKNGTRNNVEYGCSSWEIREINA